MALPYSYQNPVISGFNPDPSICRVGDDFFLVTSTFEFLPGVPVYHSKNLANWTLVNACLTEKSQLMLENCRPSGGIYAPTIRHSNGVFYMTTTNVSHKGNFIVYTKDIRAKWSDPVWVDQAGIDPSLLFDEDGSVYFCSACQDGIYLCRINPLTGEKLSPSTRISDGCGGKCPEAPHIYKIDGYYYLMLAEGGTEYGHMVTIQRSKKIEGPYTPCPHNPILSHKDYVSPIQATGHADIVEDQNGNWWMVCLGIRTLPDVMLHNLGRETFLTPVKWQNGWPVVGNNGTIALEMSGPLPGPVQTRCFDFHDEFEESTLNLNWNYLRNPDASAYSLTERTGCVKLTGNETNLSTPNASPAFIGIRQPAFTVEATTKLFCTPQENQKSGITAFYNHDYHYELYVTQQNGKTYICLSKRLFDLEAVTAKREIQYKGTIALRISADTEFYRFSYRLPTAEWIELGSGMTRALCTECTHTMTFTGTYLGLFSVGGAAFFDSFDLLQAR
jgi:xylan 1,4-beta-xylosidase